MRFKKSFGQVFLRDRRYIHKIVKSLSLDNDIVVEVGPGSGQITRYLIEKARHLYCIEKDALLIGLLKERFSSDSVTILNEDILQFDLSSLRTKVVIFSNVPFNISSRFMRYLVENRDFIKKTYLTFQKEFVNKMVAPCNAKGYGYLSCLAQYYSQIKVFFNIPKIMFFPRPKVDASFVEIEFLKKPPFKVKDEEFLFGLIKISFSSRKKKIINALEKICDKDTAERALKECKIDWAMRPGELPLEAYCKLARYLLSCLK